jgi:hypothetical protein
MQRRAPGTRITRYTVEESAAERADKRSSVGSSAWEVEAAQQSLRKERLARKVILAVSRCSGIPFVRLVRFIGEHSRSAMLLASCGMELRSSEVALPHSTSPAS